MNEANRPYKWLAKYYDQLFTFHLPWFEAARQLILGDILPHLDSACDLACGTGTTALLLAGRGIKMFGVDLSPVMCRLAREKAHRGRLPLRLFRADMRDFRLPETVGLVLCEFDALNHVPRKTDLRRVAHSVSRALRPGGYFYFDVNNRRAFEKIWPGSSWAEQPGVVMLMHGGYDRKRDRGWSNVEWFLREGKFWRRHHERIEQVAWTQGRSAARCATPASIACGHGTRAFFRECRTSVRAAALSTWRGRAVCQTSPRCNTIFLYAN